MKKLSIIILILTLSVTNIYASNNDTITDHKSKKEQRKIKNLHKIQRALTILQSYQFKFIDAYYYRRSRLSTDGVARLDISDPAYTVISTDINTVKDMYTLVYSRLRSNGEDTVAIKVEYNFKTGYLEVKEKWGAKGRYAPFFTGNYSCIYALDEEPVK